MKYLAETKVAVAAALLRNLEATAADKCSVGDGGAGGGGALFFSGAALEDDGVVALCRLLRGSSLVTSLCLADCDVRARGGAALVGLLQCNPSLTELDLEENYELPARLKEQCASLLVRNRSLPGLLLRRYQPDSGRALHRSATSVVLAAVDCRGDSADGHGEGDGFGEKEGGGNGGHGLCGQGGSVPVRVALKLMRERAHLEQELDARRALEGSRGSGGGSGVGGGGCGGAIRVLGFHVPAAERQGWEAQLEQQQPHQQPQQSPRSGALWLPRPEPTDGVVAGPSPPGLLAGYPYV